MYVCIMVKRGGAKLQLIKQMRGWATLLQLLKMTYLLELFFVLATAACLARPIQCTGMVWRYLRCENEL